jgi:hypothetical protein
MQNEIKDETNGCVAVDHTLKFPECESMDIKVKSKKGIEYKLVTYRYPVPEGIERKGIIFYIHGYGSYCEK